MFIQKAIRGHRRFIQLTSILSLTVAEPASASLSAAAAEMNKPVATFRIVGNLYYVGASDVAPYLVITPKAHILIDAGFADTALQIESNIAALGVRLTDVKWLLNGHAHPDHAGGLSKLKLDTGAQFAAMGAEVLPLENNGRGSFYMGDKPLFASVQVDRTLRNGEVIEFGGTKLTALLTAGHTPGCTTWSVQIRDGVHHYRAVIACQLGVPENPYAGMAPILNIHSPYCALCTAMSSWRNTQRLSRSAKSWRAKQQCRHSIRLWIQKVSSIS